MTISKFEFTVPRDENTTVYKTQKGTALIE